MYNRYIPQPDGTYRRSRISDSHGPEEPKRTESFCQPVQSVPKPQEPKPVPPPKPCSQGRPPRPQTPPRKQQECSSFSVGNFLRQLLPRDFDTADLIVVLLLLLIATDGCEDGNHALLTLVLYLFL